MPRDLELGLVIRAGDTSRATIERARRGVEGMSRAVNRSEVASRNYARAAALYARAARR